MDPTKIVHWDEFPDLREHIIDYHNYQYVRERNYKCDVLPDHLMTDLWKIVYSFFPHHGVLVSMPWQKFSRNSEPYQVFVTASQYWFLTHFYGLENGGPFELGLGSNAWITVCGNYPLHLYFVGMSGLRFRNLNSTDRLVFKFVAYNLDEIAREEPKNMCRFIIWNQQKEFMTKEELVEFIKQTNYVGDALHFSDGFGGVVNFTTK
jgi:hypothetical protein